MVRKFVWDYGKCGLSRKESLNTVKYKERRMQKEGLNGLGGGLEE